MLDELHRSLEAGATVLTPTRRLARHVLRSYDLAQIQAGRLAWPSAEVLPWGAWVERTLGDLLERGNHCPQLLSSAQELEVWRGVIGDLQPDVDATWLARLARDAWGLQHEWRIAPPPDDLARTDEVRAYARWAAEFTARCRRRGWVSWSAAAERLCGEAMAACGSPQIVLYAFDALSIQQRAILDACGRAGCIVRSLAPEPRPGHAWRAAYGDSAAEYAGVAARARVLLTQNPALRIGIVVPDLASERAALTRALDEALDPGAAEAATPGRGAPYNVSLGLPLSRWAPVRTLQQVLRWCGEDLALGEVGELLLSPFLGAGQSELHERALYDATLRRRGALSLSAEDFAHGLADYHRATGRCPVLAASAAHWLALTRALRGSRLPSQWSDAFVGLLGALGWPGERTLDSTEHQVVVRAREVLRQLATLDVVSGRVVLHEALAQVSRTMGETLFQAETGDAPVQVLGVLESAGLEFDHLFVTGMTDQAWPSAPRPNALLPLAIQRARGVPHAHLEWERAFAQRMMGLWSATAASVVFTYSLRRVDAPMRLSALIAALPEHPAVGDARPGSRAAALFAARRTEIMQEGQAPPVPPSQVIRGGTNVLREQSACPFKAFAMHRLFARELEEGRIGPDARERGQLLHAVMAAYTRRLGSLDQLLAVSAESLREHIDGAVLEGIDSLSATHGHLMPEAFREIERQRLARLLEALVNLERGRAPYRVVASESPVQIALNGLSLRARPDRIDEVDVPGHGTRPGVIDYKTGKTSISDWFGRRPRDPQLPLYALTLPGNVGLVAFASLRAQKVEWKGLALQTDLMPGVQSPDAAVTREPGIDGWEAMLAHWRVNLERLAAEFLQGHAQVDPRDGRKTCKQCRLEMLCRIGTHAGESTMDDDEDDA